jgi:hypothetical protein
MSQYGPLRANMGHSSIHLYNCLSTWPLRANTGHDRGTSMGHDRATMGHDKATMGHYGPRWGTMGHYGPLSCDLCIHLPIYYPPSTYLLSTIHWSCLFRSTTLSHTNIKEGVHDKGFISLFFLPDFLYTYSQTTQTVTAQSQTTQERTLHSNQGEGMGAKYSGKHCGAVCVCPTLVPL